MIYVISACEQIKSYESSMKTSTVSTKPTQDKDHLSKLGMRVQIPKSIS